MTMQQLIDQRTNLVLQRSQAKDIVEAAERQLGSIAMAIQVLEANTPKDEGPKDKDTTPRLQAVDPKAT